ncbi:MAG: DUF4198 domain-containing protein [Gemmatimonadota bacterium]
MRTATLLFALLAAAFTAANAHDFWLVPTAFSVARGTALDVSGRTSTRFPTSESAVAPDRVQSARLLSAKTDEPITGLSVSGKALRLQHRPAADGQYLVTVALVARESRTTPERLRRYIALEGAPALAQRYEADGAYPKADSVVQIVSKFAKTIVEVGRGGTPAYTRRAGDALEIVPLDDPRTLKADDVLHVQLLYRGTPLAQAELFAGGADAGDTLAGHEAKKDSRVLTDADGRAAIPLGAGQLWNVRSLHAAPAPGGDAVRWEVLFSTLVVQLGGGHGAHDAHAARESNGEVALSPSRPAGDSADVAAVVQAFHAALASGDSSAALALLAADVTILESGGVETRAQYRDRHLAGDIAFARAVPSRRSATQVWVRGDAAWVTSTSVTEGEYRGRAVNSTGVELAVLTREVEGWRIRAIHWSSRAKR